MDGRLYGTGPDSLEVYVLRIPEAGGVLELIEVLPFEGRGQGIAWDPADPGVLFGVQRDLEQIVATRIELEEPPPAAEPVCRPPRE